MKLITGLTCFLLMLISGLVFGLRPTNGQGEKQGLSLIEADNQNIQYTGRIDFTNPKRPRFWSPGVYLKASFKGSDCEIVVNDEVLYGNSHNYLEVAIDNRKPVRIKLTEAVNTIKVAEGLPEGAHTITICKNTESGIGYLEFIGFKCERLLPLPAQPARKLEFIGDSITCGTGSDLSRTPCDQGQWYDQHNAYLSYGPIVARQLNAQWSLSAVSGIGLIHSCCDMSITMPQVFDKMNLRTDTGNWDFARYQPDAVTICLGQNDGLQDPAAFTNAYIKFIQRLRGYYPQARIVCLTSPMGDETLTSFLKSNLTRVVARLRDQGDQKVSTFFFSRQFHAGCGGHPDQDDHFLMADELSAYLKSILEW
ncbi:MAG TPA: SGNH/GDSL hydrolase family protein [Blastocatellia bacterium]|nr:SGNH/GDSL hydrolase family protein [Blastocatellia bacterium]